MRRLRIFGAGVRGALVADTIAWQFADQYIVDGFYDDGRDLGSEGPGGAQVLGTVEDGLRALAVEPEIATFIGFGTLVSTQACDLLVRLRSTGVDPINLVCQDAHVAPSVTIGCNALVLPGAYLGTEAVVGDLYTAHGGAVVEHHCSLGHNVILGPNTALASFCVVDDHTFVGAGASVVPEVTIGVGTLVGSGAVVTQDLPPHSIAVGAPARVARATKAGDEVPTNMQVVALAAAGFGHIDRRSSV